MQRRNFLRTTSTLAAGMVAAQASALTAWRTTAKKRVALVGTGIRGSSLWGKNLVDNYGAYVEFVGLSDINPGRLAYVREYTGANCPTFTDFGELLTTVKPEWVVVTTMDSTHHAKIIEAMEGGANVITEKPLTTDADKLRAILAAKEKTGRELLVTFNYRHAPQATRLKALLAQERVGKLTSVDFNWYLNVYHGASYFRRWHGLQEFGGSLWVHKATHHFDLLNWWVGGRPVEVSAYGALEHYGKNGPFRHTHCRTCPHQQDCDYYWDITKEERLMDLYVKHEEHDGYLRDGCVYRNEIDIWDKMSAQIKYDNDVVVNYSLTTYSPYEGWRIGFNGHDGRIDSWQDIPYQQGEYTADEQADLHANELVQKLDETPTSYEEIVVHDNFKSESERIKVPKFRYGHGGGDARMLDYIFVDPDKADPLDHMAGYESGADSVLIGFAARKSIAEGRPVRIAEL